MSSEFKSRIGRLWSFEAMAVALLFPLLNLELLLTGLVGGFAATVSVLLPAVAAAYWMCLVAPSVSAPRRRELMRALRAIRRSPQAWLGFAFATLCVIAAVRSAMGGVNDSMRALYDLVRWGSAIAILLGALARALSYDAPSLVFEAACLGLLLLVCSNLLLMMIGVQNPILESHLVRKPEPGVLLRLIGIDELRRIMPLANGTGGIQVAAAFPIGLAILRERLWSPKAAVLLSGGAAVLLMLTDSRGGVFGALLATTVVVAPRRGLRVLKWMVPLAVVMPIVLIVILGALGGAATLGEVSRGGVDSISALSGRPVIWGVILLSLSNFSPVHIIGFGTSGQVASGVNAQYSFLFASAYANPATAGAHNTILQLVLDVGYLGAVLYLTMCWRGISRMASSSDLADRYCGWNRVGVAAIVSLLLLGVTDATATLNTGTTLALIAAVHAMVSGIDAIRANSTDAALGT